MQIIKGIMLCGVVFISMHGMENVDLQSLHQKIKDQAERIEQLTENNAHLVSQLALLKKEKEEHIIDYAKLVEELYEVKKRAQSEILFWPS